MDVLINILKEGTKASEVRKGIELFAKQTVTKQQVSDWKSGHRLMPEWARTALIEWICVIWEEELLAIEPSAAIEINSKWGKILQEDALAEVFSRWVELTTPEIPEGREKEANLAASLVVLSMNDFYRRHKIYPPHPGTGTAEIHREIEKLLAASVEWKPRVRG